MALTPWLWKPDFDPAPFSLPTNQLTPAAALRCTMIKLPIQLVPALFVTGLAMAQNPNVAIVAAASSTTSDCRFVDVQDMLVASGMFASVEIVDATNGTPALGQLLQFDAVLTYSNFDYQDAELLGDVLADYADTGAGVVVAGFAVTDVSPARTLGGRWVTAGYEVITTGEGGIFSAASLGQIVDASHPSVQGVSSLSAQIAFRPGPLTGLEQGSVVARWDDGSILVAQGTMANRIDLGIHPPSSNCVGSFWDASGDGGLLIANSLAAVVVEDSLGTVFCSPAVNNTTGFPGSLLAFGSNVASDNNVTLRAVDLPQNQLGIFITSQTAGFVPGAGGSQGNLCVVGNLGRYDGPGEFQNSGAAGEFELLLDLTQTPTTMGTVMVMAGQTWNFQGWHRDFIAGQGPTSNFTDAVEILFQ